MVNHDFISFSAVQVYDLSYIHLQIDLGVGYIEKLKIVEANFQSKRLNQNVPLCLPL